MKQFEYMAARRPVVVSDMPAIREILDESCAFFCAPGVPESFVRAVETASEAPREMIEQAFARVRHYTWHERAKRIADFCTS